MKKMFFIALLLSQTPAFAFDVGQLLAPPSMQKNILSLGGVYYHNADVSEAVTTSQMGIGEFQLQLPFLQQEDSTWTFSIGGKELKLEPNNSPYPDLYDIKAGLAYSKTLENGKQWTVHSSFGSASDKPFTSAKDNTLNITAIYTSPIDPVKKWLYFLNYSNNRSFLNNVPLPGIAWMYTPSREFALILGAPFLFLNWQFSEKMGLSTFTLLPYTFRGQIYYRMNPVSQVYFGLDASQMVHYLHDREKDKERLFYDERKIFIGAKSPLAKGLMAEAELGYAFDRKFFSAENYSWRPEDATNIGSAPFARLQLKYIF